VTLYAQYEKGGDKLVSRLAFGLPEYNSNVAILPPRLVVSKVEEDGVDIYNAVVHFAKYEQEPFYRAVHIFWLC
jgi:hypothetical protein